MRTRTTSGLIRGFLTEYTAAKTGILLDNSQLFEILGRDEQFCNYIPILRDDCPIVIRPELMEAAVLFIRAQLGNLPDAAPDAFFAKELFLSMGGRATRQQLYQLMFCVRMWGIAPGAPNSLGHIIKSTGLPEPLLRKWFKEWDRIRDRTFDPFNEMPEEKEWDTRVPLSSLFDQEQLPSDPEHYLDQRFIDYLVAQGQDLSRIHWRNFERLCSEFFRRQNHRVELCPQGGDGGIDVRVFPEGSAPDLPTPPLIVIQCKRLQESDYVQVADAKALYLDSVHEKSKGSLLVTTGIIGPSIRELRKVRKYKLGIATAQRVQGWLRSMWRYK